MAKRHKGKPATEDKYRKRFKRLVDQLESHSDKLRVILMGIMINANQTSPLVHRIIVFVKKPLHNPLHCKNKMFLYTVP